MNAALNIQLRTPAPAMPRGPWTPLRPLYPTPPLPTSGAGVEAPRLQGVGGDSAPRPTPDDVTDALLEAAAALEDAILQHVFHIYGYCAMLRCDIAWNADGELVFDFPVDADAGDADHLEYALEADVSTILAAFPRFALRGATIKTGRAGRPTQAELYIAGLPRPLPPALAPEYLSREYDGLRSAERKLREQAKALRQQADAAPTIERKLAGHALANSVTELEIEYNNVAMRSMRTAHNV